MLYTRVYLITEEPHYGVECYYYGNAITTMETQTSSTEIFTV